VRTMPCRHHDKPFPQQAVNRQRTPHLSREAGDER